MEQFEIRRLDEAKETDFSFISCGEVLIRFGPLWYTIDEGQIRESGDTLVHLEKQFPDLNINFRLLLTPGDKKELMEIAYENAWGGSLEWLNEQDNKDEIIRNVESGWWYTGQTDHK